MKELGLELPSQESAPLVSDTLTALGELAPCVVASSDTTFMFDVPSSTYEAVVSFEPAGTLVVRGFMSLAVYNDLKLSEFIREDGVQSKPEHRHFTLTDRGLRMVEG